MTKAVSGKITFKLPNKKSMKGIILCVLYVILACIERQLSNLKKNYEVDSCVYFFVESLTKMIITFIKHTKIS